MLMTSILPPDAASWSNERPFPCRGHAEQYASIRAYQARCAKILAQRQVHRGPRAKKSPSTPSTAIFRPFFPRWANFFAFAFTSARTRRTFSRPEHRDVITVKPTASLNARPGTTLSQQPPSHTLGGTKLSQHAKKRLFWPKMHQQGEFCTARRA